MLENLHTTANPVAAPQAIPRIASGCSSQRTKQKSASATPAVQATSLVATPACPRNGDEHTNRSTAQNPAASLNQRRAHTNTTTQASTKKGSVPIRARVRFRQ